MITALTTTARVVRSLVFNTPGSPVFQIYPITIVLAAQIALLIIFLISRIRKPTLQSYPCRILFLIGITNNASVMKATKIKTINHGIQKILLLAENDFQMVRAFIKIYYDNRANYESNLTFRKIERLIQELVTELQHVDAFEQRLKHLIDFDNTVQVGADDKSIESAYLHLNFFQLITIESDLFAAITTTESLLSELHSYLNQASYKWFESKTAITRFFDSIKRDILIDGKDETQEPIKTLPLELENSLKSFYSMETERFVLNWFQTRMPYGTSVELLRNYDVYKNILATNTVELF